MTKLPDKLSELMRVALVDLAKVEADPRYTVDMHLWHVPQENGTCAVCFAGSVMAKSLGRSRARAAVPGLSGNWMKFHALDDLRLGCVVLAAQELGLKTVVGNRRVARYRDDPCAWRRDMEQILSDLEAVGE